MQDPYKNQPSHATRADFAIDRQINYNYLMPEGYTHHPEMGPQHYQPFDPEEALEELKTELAVMTKEEREEKRPELFATLRAEVATQRDEIAKIANELEEYKKDNPEADTETLLRIVNERASEARLSPRQIDVFKHHIDNIILADKEVESTIQQFQEIFSDEWQQKLFEEYFEFALIGNVEVTTGSGALHFHLQTQSDWRNLARRRQEDEGIYQPNISGFAYTVKKNPDQHFIVTASRELSGRTKMLFGPAVHGETVQHEAKHAQDFILEPLSLPEIRKVIATSNLDMESNDEEVEAVIDRIMPMAEDVVLRLARSEILAYFRTIDYMAENLDSFRKLLGGVVISGLKIFGKDKQGEVSGLYHYSFNKDGKQHRNERNARLLQYSKRGMENPAHGGTYNYEELMIEALSSYISPRVGRDCRELVRPHAEELFEQLAPRLVEFIDAAIEMMRITNLSGREVDWLLQNRPMQYWPAMAKDLERAQATRRAEG